MKNVTTTPELSPSTTDINSHLFDDWFDPIESGIRDRVRGLIEEMIRGELDAALSRPRYGRRAAHAEDSGVAAVVTGPSAREPGPHADGNLREDRDCGAASPAEHFRRQNHGMEKPGAAGLSAAHAGRGTR